MDTEILKTLGKISGIGGISLGVLLIFFRDVIRKRIFPQLTRRQAFQLLILMVVLVWSVAIAGILAWAYGESLDKPAIRDENNVATSFEVAVRMLGNENEEVRIGGVYALQRLCKERPGEIHRSVEILAAYIRRKSPAPPGTRNDFQIGKRAPNDIYTAFQVLSNLQESSEEVMQRIDLSEIYAPYSRLEGAFLPNTDFTYAILNGTHLGNGNFTGGDFSGASLDECSCQGANMSRVKMQPTHLDQAHLNKANLSYSDLRASHFNYADLSDSNLEGADLRYADLSFAKLSRANLKRVNLQGRMASYVSIGDLGELSAMSDEERARHIEKKYKEGPTGQRYEGAKFFRTDLAGAILTQTDLRGAKLKEVVGLTTDQLQGAYWDKLTEFPDELALKLPPEQLPPNTVDRADG